MNDKSKIKKTKHDHYEIWYSLDLLTTLADINLHNIYSMKAAVGIKGAEDPYQRFSKGISWQIIMTNCLSNIIYKKVKSFTTLIIE